jgi:hypothetical protein
MFQIALISACASSLMLLCRFFLSFSADSNFDAIVYLPVIPVPNPYRDYENNNLPNNVDFFCYPAFFASQLMGTFILLLLPVICGVNYIGVEGL